MAQIVKGRIYADCPTCRSPFSTKQQLPVSILVFNLLDAQDSQETPQELSKRTPEPVLSSPNKKIKKNDDTDLNDNIGDGSIYDITPVSSINEHDNEQNADDYDDEEHTDGDEQTDDEQDIDVQIDVNPTTSANSNSYESMYYQQSIAAFQNLQNLPHQTRGSKTFKQVFDPFYL